MFLLTLFRNAPTNALPSTPTPAGSSRPRAKTTSTCGHAADADGTALLPGRIEGPTSRAVAESVANPAAARPRRMRRPILLVSRRKITSPMLADELTHPLQRESELHPARDEIGRGVDKSACVAGGPVRGDILSVGLADRIAAVAQIDRPSTPHRAHRQRQSKLRRGISEYRDRGDEVGGIG